MTNSSCASLGTRVNMNAHTELIRAACQPIHSVMLSLSRAFWWWLTIADKNVSDLTQNVFNVFNQHYVESHHPVFRWNF